MKGKILKLRHLLTMAILVACLVGCGNQESTTTEPTTEVEEPTVAEKPTETVEPTDEMESEEVEEKEEPKQEEVTEEPTEETYNGMPVAKVETTVDNFEEFLNYVDSLDNQTPALLIYNENEGYVINMGEGEYYQLKTDDRIFEYDSERSVAITDTLKAGAGTNIKEYLYEMIPDYSQYDKPHKVIYKVFFTEDYQNGDCFRLDCYLDAPAE